MESAQLAPGVTGHLSGGAQEGTQGCIGEGEYGGKRVYPLDPPDSTPLVGAQTDQHPPLETGLSQRAIQAQIKDDIRQLYRRGELVGRSISVTDPSSNRHLSRPMSEFAYQAGELEPRPGTLMREGLRVGLYEEGLGSGLYIGLAPVEELYSYKKDVGSRENQSLHSRPKQLQPNWSSLFAKISEHDNRLDSHYLVTTSGHMMKTGELVSGHAKDVAHDNKEYLDTNETMTTGYRAEQIRCVIIDKYCNLASLQRQLESKCKLERELSLPELPVAFYDARAGSLREIIFLSELEITEASLPELASTIGKIKQLTERIGSINLEQMLLQLPPSRLLACLRSSGDDIDQSIGALSSLYREELRQAVEGGDWEQVKTYSQNGANLTALYYQHGHPHNLLQLLLSSPSTSVWADETHRSAPHKLAAQTQIGKLLYDHGCRVDQWDDLIRELPGLAAYMIAQGEPCSTICWPHRIFQALSNYLTDGIISEGELQTILRGIKQSCTIDPEQLNAGYTRFLHTLLDLSNDPQSMNWKLPDIRGKSRSSTWSVADQVQRTAAIVSAFGVTADMDKLRQALQSSGQNESALLLVKKLSDLDRLSSLFTNLKQLRQWARCPERFADPRQWDRGVVTTCADRQTQQEQERLREKLIEMLNQLYLFEKVYDLDTRTTTSRVPREQAGVLADYLAGNDLEAAEALVQQLHRQLLLPVEKKQQALEALCQELVQIQGSEVCQSARVAAKARTNEITVIDHEQTSTETTETVQLTWLAELFRFAPETAGKNYRELSQVAMDHYYRMLHPNQVKGLISTQQSLPEPLKKEHGVEHVTRTQILAEALLELFANHDPNISTFIEQRPSLQELIPLAMVYHDATAEVEDKSVEELSAAKLFEHDMTRSGRYSVEDIALVAGALVNKESDALKPDALVPPFTPDQTCTSQERVIRRILRLADRIDVIRATHVPRGWKQGQESLSRSTFDYRRLDLPEALSAGFTRDFHALLEGAKDLAYVTGGVPLSDNSVSHSYLDRYRLQGDKDKRKQKVTRAPSARDSVLEALNDNVRRAIARAAGIDTCDLDHSKKSVWEHAGRLPCLVEKHGRDTLTAIHSELELRQIQLPQTMTTVQKLMFAQLGVDCLPSAIKAEIEQEIARLKQYGIRPPLGTLTQAVLNSEPAQQRLKQHYQLEVVQQRRFCGWDCTDGKAEKRYTTVLCPRPIHVTKGRSKMGRAEQQVSAPEQAIQTDQPVERRSWFRSCVIL